MQRTIRSQFLVWSYTPCPCWNCRQTGHNITTAELRFEQETTFCQPTDKDKSSFHHQQNCALNSISQHRTAAETDGLIKKLIASIYNKAMGTKTELHSRHKQNSKLNLPT